jgi:hypothetical protein
MSGMFGNFFGGSNNGGASGGGIAHGAAGPVAVPLNPAPGSQQQQQDPVGGGTGNNGGNNQQNEPAKASSPLDTLKDFWQNPMDAEGKPIQQPADPTAATIYNLDPAKVSESARKLDFMAGIEPATITKALGGDVAAFMDVINGAVQNSFAAATLQTGNMINTGVSTNNTRFKSTLPSQIRAVQVDQATASNPVLSHPAAAPLFNTLKSFAAAKNPNASPAEITAQVEALLTGFSEAMQAGSPKAQQQAQAAKAGEQDWSSFFEPAKS